MVGQQKDLGEYSYSLKDVINPQSGASRSNPRVQSWQP
jgi:hypothetical protein